MIVATRRLIEKQKNVSELLPATEGHLQSLESLENHLETSLRTAKDHVELKFAALRNALDHRKEVLLGELQEAASKYTESVTLYKRKTCDVLKEAEKVSVSYSASCPSAAIDVMEREAQVTAFHSASVVSGVFRITLSCSIYITTGWLNTLNAEIIYTSPFISAAIEVISLGSK